MKRRPRPILDSVTDAQLEQAQRAYTELLADADNLRRRLARARGYFGPHRHHAAVAASDLTDHLRAQVDYLHGVLKQRDEPDERPGPDAMASHGPFCHGTGGGHRNVRKGHEMS